MITITHEPQLFTPVNSPVVFSLSSDTANLVSFYVQVLDSATQNVIANQKYQTLPTLTNGTVFDLSSILSNMVDYQLVISDNIIEPTPHMLQAYTLNITENYFSGTTVYTGATLSSSTLNVWNGGLNRIGFTNYDYYNYAVTSTGSTTKFLTNKPLITNLYRTSTEFLYFLNAGLNANIQLKVYGSGNTLIGNHIISGITASTSSYRINVSPTLLSTYFGDDFSNTYGGEFQDMFGGMFGANFGINEANYFTVTLVDTSGNTKSETRTYILKNSPCNFTTVQLLFSNNKGGYDSVNMFNPVESIAVTKTTINKYPYQLTASGVYTDNSGSVYNEVSTVTNSTNVSTYKVISDVLSDDSAVWIKGLLQAEKVYVGLANGMYLPVTINTNSYTITPNRYSSNNNRLEVDFVVNESGLKFTN